MSMMVFWMLFWVLFAGIVGIRADNESIALLGVIIAYLYGIFNLLQRKLK